MQQLIKAIETGTKWTKKVVEFRLTQFDTQV